MTSSAFVLDWSRPVPLDEFFLPVAEVSLPAFRACVKTDKLKWRRWRMKRQDNATANDRWYSSAQRVRRSGGRCLALCRRNFRANFVHTRRGVFRGIARRIGLSP